MLSANCPSCGSSITFRHAASAAVVCEACNSTVIREGVDLSAVGKVSSFARDLSPIQLGARGEYGSRGFVVAGVLRKVRDRVRWNEWYVVFDSPSDGGGRGGWLGEGNGEYQMFAEDPIPLRGAPRNPKVGGILPLEGVKWRVTESATARVAAAQGELPYPVTQSQAFPYADLRSTDGKRFATLDGADDPPLFYAGRVVTLQSLQFQGLRHFTGWSDPALTGFQGPDIEAVRSLKCAGCGATIQLRAPGETVRVGCEYCGSLSATQEGPGGGVGALTLIERSEEARFKPPIKLGSRGALQGCDWEVIGAMVRYVRIEGIDYSWVEHMLHNPYRGYAWLVVDGQSHWNFVTRIPDLPKGEAGSWRPVEYRKNKFKHFQSGVAHVRAVVGEFTWEVRAGDTAATTDYIAPPQMLSSEITGAAGEAGGEIVWTQGVWLPPEDIEAAFGGSQKPATGVAPHQPNPYDHGIGKAITRALMLVAAVCLLWVYQSLINTPLDLVDATWKTSDDAVDVFVTEPFQVFEGDAPAVPPAVPPAVTPPDAPDGDAPDGDAPDGDAPDGDAPNGDAPNGDAPDGDAPPSEPPPVEPPPAAPPSLDLSQVEALDSLQIKVSTPIDRRDGQIHVALMNLNTGRVYLMDIGQGKKNQGKAWLADPEVGTYVGRIELAKNPSRAEVAFHRDVRLQVRTGVSWRTPLFLAGLLALLAPLFHALARGAFEAKRWSQSDHAG